MLLSLFLYMTISGYSARHPVLEICLISGLCPDMYTNQPYRILPNLYVIRICSVLNFKVKFNKF